MTTSVEISSTENIFCANEVMNFSGVSSARYELGAALWLTRGLSHIDAMTVVLQLVYEKILNSLNGSKVWFIAGNSAWQQDTRIVRHHKLWRALKARGVEIQQGSDTQEVLIEAGGKLKFFGATQLSCGSLQSAAKALVSERCTYLLVSTRDFNIAELLNEGWSGELRHDSNLLSCAFEHDVLVFARIGEFDDPERGLGAIGNPRILKKLLN